MTGAEGQQAVPVRLRASQTRRGFPRNLDSSESGPGAVGPPCRLSGRDDISQLGWRGYQVNAGGQLED